MTSVARLARRAVWYELGLWRSLYRWTFRRPAARGPGAEAFGYAAPVTPVLAAFIGLSALEIPVVELLLPWELARRVFLALGAYGVFWMFGLLASLRVHPHVVDDAGLRVRYGLSLDVTVPWDAIGEIRARRRSLRSGRSGKAQLEEHGAALILHVPVTSSTNVDVALRRPTAVSLPGGRRESVTELRFYADDPHAVVGRARARRLEAQPA